MEEWKAVSGYEGRYEVSNLGRVRNARTKRELRPSIAKTRYLVVNLTSARSKQRVKLIHRLVAEAFIPNPEGKPEVNHIDGNRANPVVANLEWVTSKENSIHASRVTKTTKGVPKPRPIRCIETGRTFNSAQEASEQTGISRANICTVARGGTSHHTAGGYHWEFLDRKPKPYTPKPKAMPQHIIKIVECVETGERFLGTHAASRATGGGQTNIAKACREPHRTCGGYHWRYIGEAKWKSKTLPGAQR